MHPTSSRRVASSAAGAHVTDRSRTGIEGIYYPGDGLCLMGYQQNQGLGLFCAVCQQAFIRSVRAHVSAIEAPTPTQTFLSAREGVEWRVQVRPVPRAGHAGQQR